MDSLSNPPAARSPQNKKKKKEPLDQIYRGAWSGVDSRPVQLHHIVGSEFGKGYLLLEDKLEAMKFRTSGPPVMKGLRLPDDSELRCSKRSKSSFNC